MKTENILRLALIMNDNKSSTFNTNLGRMINVILFDDVDKSLSLEQIKQIIFDKYDLEVTIEEVEKAINSKHSKVKKIKSDKENNFEYMLSPEEVERIKKIQEKNSINNIIMRFCKEYDIKITKEEMEALIDRFLYNSFNMNRQVLCDLINGDYENIEFDKKEICNEDRIILNKFLNWDDDEKDKYIYNTIVYCVDFCTMTLKKDFSSFNNIFKGKIFYIDSNIIFRLIGVNNDERKNNISAFINKCKDVGIIIRYTNFTYQEIMQTCEHLVNGLKMLLNNHEMLSVENYELFSMPGSNLDILHLYKKWLKDTLAEQNDYNEFASWLKKEAKEILRAFDKIDVFDNKISDEAQYESMKKSLEVYKKEHKARYTENGIGIDVNNILYISNERKKEKGDSFFNIQNYMISADTNLCEWVKEIIPGSVPIAILPSVWYSLMLRFTGRSNDDYKAFISFLNLRYRIGDEEFDDRRPKILAFVQNMNEPLMLKEKILEDINMKLMDEYKEIEEVEEIVFASQENVLELERKKAIDNEAPGLMEKGELFAYMNIAEKKAKFRARAIKAFEKGVNRTAVGVGIICFILGIYLIVNKKVIEFLMYFNNEELNFDITHWFVIISAVIGFFRITLYIPLKNFLDRYDVEKETNKIYEKLIKKYKNKN